MISSYLSKVGYEAKNISVKNDETAITITATADSTYSFTIPAGAVTVNFTLKPITYSDVDGATFTAQNSTENIFGK